MHFKITANSGGPVGVGQFSFAISTSTATTSNFQLFAFTDSSYSQAVSGQGTGGQIGVTSPVASVTRGLTLVHLIGIKYTDYFTDGTNTFAFPGDPAIDSKFNQPNAPIPTHPGLTWVQSTSGPLYDTPSGDLEVGDYVVQPDGSVVTNAPVNTDGVHEIFVPTVNPMEIPAGTTYYFELRASVAPGASITAKMLGDSAYGATFTDGYNAQTFDQAGNKDAKNFVWSGNSTSTSQTADIDWSDGFGLPGLPASGLVMTRTN
jgi:hypothetical protein